MAMDRRDLVEEIVGEAEESFVSVVVQIPLLPQSFLLFLGDL